MRIVLKLLEMLKMLFKFDEPDKAMEELLRNPPSKPDKPLPDRSSKSLDDLDPGLASAFRLIREEYRFKNPGYTLRPVYTYRSVKEQQKLYAQGRSTPGKIVTYKDGIKKKSKHNYYPSRAIDVCVIKASSGKCLWDTKYYKCLPELANKISKSTGIKVVNGGSWTKFKDWGHFQI